MLRPILFVVGILLLASLNTECDGSDNDSAQTPFDDAFDGQTADTADSSGAANPQADISNSPDIGEPTRDGLDTTDENSIQFGCFLPEELIQPATMGLVYLDVDNSSTSTYDGVFDPNIDTPVEGALVQLLGPTGVLMSTATCPDGSYGFGDLAEGTYVVDFGFMETEFTTKNRARYFPKALRAGDVHIVTIGDSVPKVGDAPFFPERIGSIIKDFGKITVDNIAIPGTTSEHWLPGTFNYNKELVPLLATADVVIISLGGNDVLQYVQENANDLSKIAAALENFPAFVQGIRERVTTIANAIRLVNPQLDIVYCLYPNYAESDLWNEMLSGFGGLVKGYVDDALTQVRASIKPSDNILLVDLFGGTKGIDLDDILYDYLHFNDEGQRLYAEEIFVILGGIRVGEDPLGLVRDVGIASP